MRTMLVQISAAAALLLYGCSATGVKEPAGGDRDAGQQQQAEAGAMDARAPRPDTARPAAPDAGMADAGEAGGEPPEIHRCLQGDTTHRRNDDAGVEDPAASGPSISGKVALEDECLAGAEVCLSYFDVAGYHGRTVLTDRSGAFEFPAPYQDPFYTDPDGVNLDLTPRKFGVEFDPPTRELQDVQRTTDIRGLRFNATRVDIPDHAIGRWRVVDAYCVDGTADGGTPTGSNDCDDSGASDAIGTVLVFENGCLFGGISCVKELSYSDENAVCRTDIQWGMARSSPTISRGEFDRQAQTWRIRRRSAMFMLPMGGSVRTTEMVLERAP